MPPVVPAGHAPAPSVAPTGASKAANSNSGLIKTIIIVGLTLLLVTAAGLAVYFYNEYKVASTNIDAKIKAAVIESEKEITAKLEDDFAKREKIPYNTFAGPSDLGSINFKYPKTWSVYIAKDAAKGGDFEAYLHPGQVNPITNTDPIAIRLTIKSESFETADSRYKGLIQNGVLASSVIKLNNDKNDATRYDGELPNKLTGSVVIFKIRDKTVTLQTDAEIYREDFDQILTTITFNE